MHFDEYAAYDGLGLAGLIRNGEITASELVETALAAIERLNPVVNAVVHRMDQEARRVVRAGVPAGPFGGVPFLLKDLIALYRSTPYTAGSRLLAGYVADHDTELVRRYRRAGFVVAGKTNTPEFGLVPFTEPDYGGPTRNPWDLSRTCGGSSGGSAVAVACGMVPIAGGGDGGGSIRIPAACCGVFGLKPTRGRTPTGPDYGELWAGCVVEHVLTRSVRDSAAVLDLTAGPDVGAPYAAPPPARPFLEEVTAAPGRLRVAFTTSPFLADSVAPECRDAVLDVARLLDELGHHVEEAAPVVDRERFARAFMDMLIGELRADLDDAETLLGRRAGPRHLEVETWALALLDRRRSAARYVRAVRYLQRAARGVAAFFETYDVLLTPTLAQPPVPLGALRPRAAERVVLAALGRLRAARLLDMLDLTSQAAEQVFGFTPFTPVFNVTGQPAMSVPLVWSAAGLPIGVHFVARYGDEATLFRLAGQLESARPWFGRLPPWVREQDRI